MQSGVLDKKRQVLWHCLDTPNLERAKKIFQHEFNQRLMLEQLLFLEDVEDVQIVWIKPPVTKKQLAIFFQKQIQGLSL